MRLAYLNYFISLALLKKVLDKNKEGGQIRYSYNKINNLNINKKYHHYKNDDFNIFLNDNSKLKDFLKKNNYFDDINFPKQSNYFQLVSYIFFSVFNNNQINNKLKFDFFNFKTDNKIFKIDYLKTNKKNKRNLILFNHGLGVFKLDRKLLVNNPFYYQFNFLCNDYDLMIFNRLYFNIQRNITCFEPFDTRVEFYNLVNYIEKNYNYDNIYLLGLSSGCLNTINYLNNPEFIISKKIKCATLVSGTPDIKQSIINSTFNSQQYLKYYILDLLDRKSFEYYQINRNMSLYKIIGTIGKKNKNLESINDYFKSIAFNKNNIKNISVPVFFLNSKDDDIANFYYFKEYINDLLDNLNICIFLTNFGWHGIFLDRTKTFLKSIITKIFDSFN